MQPPISITRNYYYQGELLVADDFKRDQQYVRDVLMATNSALYAPGVVASGLQIAPQPPHATAITLSPGLAFDPNGVPLMVFAGFPAQDVSSVAAGTYWVVLLYGDNVNQNNTQVLQATKTIIERPTVQLVADASKRPPTGVILGQAIVTVGNNGQRTVAVDMTAKSGRQVATLRMQLASSAPPPPPPQPQPAPGAPAGPVAGPLAVGPSLKGAGAPLQAPLSVALDFASGIGAQAVASFGFSNGKNAGAVSIGRNVADTSYNLLDLTYNGKPVWSVDQDGTAHTVSDARLKTDIAPIADALAAVAGLRGVSFLTASGGGRRLGVLAQDVERVLPASVRTDAAGIKSVAYDDLIGLLIEAVKDLSARVADLQRRLDGGREPS